MYVVMCDFIDTKSTNIVIFKLHSCLSRKWLTFICLSWLVRLEYKKHVMSKGLIILSNPEQKHT